MVPSIERVARLVRAVRHVGTAANVQKGCALLARHFAAEADEMLCELLEGPSGPLWAEGVPGLLARLEMLGFAVECLLPNGRILIDVGEGPGLVVCVHGAPLPATDLATARVMDCLAPLFGARGFVLQFEKAPSPTGDLSRLVQAVRLWLSTPEANGTERAFYEEGDLSLHLFSRPSDEVSRVVIPELDVEQRLMSLHREWSTRPLERMPEVWLTSGRMVGQTGGAAWIQGLYGLADAVYSGACGKRVDRYAEDGGGIWRGPESAPVTSVLRWQRGSTDAAPGNLVQYDSPLRAEDTMELALGHIRYTHLIDEEDGTAGLAMGWLETASTDEERV